MALRLLILIMSLLAVCIFSCNSKQKAAGSVWLSLKDSFHLQNAREFIPDSTLVLNFFYGKLDSSFCKPKNKILDSIIGGKCYLYSWQKEDSTFTAFTILTEGFGECFEIRLLSFDRFNKLISDFTVAKYGAEAGSYVYKSESNIDNRDTIFTTHTRTYAVDEITHKKLSRIVGDTLKVKSYFDKTGHLQSLTIDSIITSPKFKNKTGFITEKMVRKLKEK